MTPAANSLRVMEDAPLQYIVAEPSDRSRGPRPVLCFLHGYDEAAPFPIELALTRHVH